MKLWEGYDSEVFLLDGTVEKRYFPHVSLDTIKRYHAIHNSLSEAKFWFECDYWISSVLNNVSSVCVRVLNLGNCISFQNGRVITSVPYVDWKKIQNEQTIEEMIFVRFLREFLRIEGINFKREDSLTFLWIWGNPLQYDLEIDPMNFRLTESNSDELEIVITDLGASVDFFVHCFLEKNPDFKY